MTRTTLRKAIVVTTAAILTSCLHVPKQTLELPVGFHGCAIVLWGEAAYPPVPSQEGDLTLHFNQDGILITSTAAPSGKMFKQVVAFVDAYGKRVSVDPVPRIEEFNGEEIAGGIKSGHTIYFVGYAGPIDGQTLEQGTRSTSDLLRRLHPDASPLRASAEPEEQGNQVNIGEEIPPQFSWIRAALWVFGPYALVGLAGGVWLFKARRSQWKANHRYMHRLFFAAYLAVMFTPSMVGDFWLFAVPGPAFVGLTLFAPGIVLGENRAAMLYIASIYYILPIALVFALAYLGLTFRACIRNRRD